MAVSPKAVGTQMGALEATGVTLLPTPVSHTIFPCSVLTLRPLSPGPPVNQEKPFAMTAGWEGAVETVMVLRQLEFISLKPLHSRAMFESQEKYPLHANGALHIVNSASRLYFWEKKVVSLHPVQSNPLPRCVAGQEGHKMDFIPD